MGRRKKAEVTPKPANGKNMQDYLVVYLTDGTIHLWPGEDKDECELISIKLKKSKWKNRIRLFKFIKRDLNKCKDGQIL